MTQASDVMVKHGRMSASHNDATAKVSYCYIHIDLGLYIDINNFNASESLFSYPKAVVLESGAIRSSRSLVI